MDGANPPPSPGTAVSDLMQQLKNGEISKMQLFQQIARMRAASAAVPVPSDVMTTASQLPPAPAFSSSPTTTFAVSSQRTLGVVAPVAPVATSASSMIFNNAESRVYSPPPAAPPAEPFVSFSYSPPRLPSQTIVAAQPRPSSSPTHATSPVLKLGIQPVESNADVFTAGVSHEKAQRLSVQEWMASKARVSAAPVVPMPRPSAPPVVLEPAPPAPPPTQPPALFSFLQHTQSRSEWEEIQPASHHASLSSPPFPQHPVDTSPMFTSQLHVQQPQITNQEARYEEYRGPVSGDMAQEYMAFDHFRDNRNGEDGINPSGKNKNSSNGDEGKFHARVTRWKSQKDALREQMKQQLLQSELDECTFAPRVNPKSTKVVAKLRGRQKSIGGDTEAVNGQSVSERLYQEADNYKAREELAARLKADEEAEVQRECTFKPRINRNNPLTDKVKPKYMEIPRKDTPVITPAVMEAAAKELEECTFQPKVNPINPEMVSAQLYLQQNIYERLSRPCVPVSDAGSVAGDGESARYVNGNCSESLDDDMLDEMMGIRTRRTQDDFYVRDQRRRGSSSVQKQQQRQRPRSAGGVASDDEKNERSRRFDDFLERQQFHEQARRKKLETTQQQLVPPHKPSINKKSLMMMENGRKGDFLERITKYAIRKEQDTVKKKTVRVSDPNCTFKPTINTYSAKRQPRSVTELSRGDLLRRETTQRLMKLKMEQEEMASLTFRPQLNRVSQRIEGRLKILDSPDTYLQRIQQQSQAQTIKHRRAVQEKEMEEFAECTFKPRTIDAPAYVQRIARSVSLTKALKKQQEAAAKANEKPEWK
ncbi:hypothetical protein Poli38472_003860 [Pythium oligandrum]|uniref:Uncharacterized protein n=1 Tax=Pythium oligandrum TaxID=41045 RepID=A0A8K1CNZ2_PYTOL|nr:hypothetical protein Poli38472_003860 [Pythium oligandrum]|eukprot:TMW66095.1 hypothetical protein Poli38472_003860 [Pythium oligandrum]